MNKGKLLPPIYFLFYLLLAIALHYFFPIKNIIVGNYKYIGFVFVGFGILIDIWASIYFKKAKTSIIPFNKSTRLLKNGPFKFSRNPIYLGSILMLLGTAIYLGSFITFLMPILFYITINKIFIAHEEKILEETFGEEYLKYKKNVKRWI